MCVQNAQILGTYPFESCVKVDDTLPGIEEGLNAGMWTVGLTKTGNEIGLNETEIDALEPKDLDAHLEKARTRMDDVGAHYIVEGIWDVPDLLDEITDRLSKGERP